MLDKYYFTDKEADMLRKSIGILVDTRENENSHITNWFDKKKIKWKSKALERGDYSFYIPQNEQLNIPRDIYFDKEIIIERKGSLEELAGNLSKERDRFEKELALAPANKVLLIENANYDDIVRGNYNFTKYSAKSFWGSIHSFWHKYNIPIIFMPDKEYSGIFIKGFFEYYLKSIIRN